MPGPWALTPKQESLELFFKRLYGNPIVLADICGFNEEGFIMGRGGKEDELVIARVRAKTRRRAQDGNQEWVALIECVRPREKDFPHSTSTQGLHTMLAGTERQHWPSDGLPRAECGINPFNHTRVLNNAKYLGTT